MNENDYYINLSTALNNLHDTHFEYANDLFNAETALKNTPAARIIAIESIPHARKITLIELEEQERVDE